MRTRRLVIADYPRSVYKIGDIIEDGPQGDVIFCDLEGPRRTHYPAIFKKLEWHHMRDPKDLPEYVKSYGREGVMAAGEGVWKVTGVPYKNGWTPTDYSGGPHVGLNPYWLIPATADEYEEYHLNKDKSKP